MFDQSRLLLLSAFILLSCLTAPLCSSLLSSCNGLAGSNPGFSFSLYSNWSLLVICYSVITNNSDLGSWLSSLYLYHEPLIKDWASARACINEHSSLVTTALVRERHLCLFTPVNLYRQKEFKLQIARKWGANSLISDGKRFYSPCLRKKQGLDKIILPTAILYNLFYAAFKQG